jgi:uncharacterized membrane protein
MHRIPFPEPFRHDHPPVRDINQVEATRLTLGQRAADRIAAIVGSWWFIGIQTLILAVWAAVNVAGWVYHWDPYPFILMNLLLSLQAAYSAPVIMMSQNRQAMRDRLEAENDYVLNRKAEEEIRAVLEHLSAQDEALRRVLLVLDRARADSSEPDARRSAAENNG